MIVEVYYSNVPVTEVTLLSAPTWEVFMQAPATGGGGGGGSWGEIIGNIEEQVDLINYIAENSGDNQIQSDWNQSDNTKKDYIKNKPTITNDFTDAYKLQIDELYKLELLKII